MGQVDAPVYAAGNTGTTIYFYSPETNINNFSSLKAEFDSYLAERGDYQLQPFSKQTDFEKFVTGKKDGVLLVSSWHYRKLRDLLRLEPILVGALKNQSTQKRVLSTKKKMKNLADLKGQKIASAGSKEYTTTILRSMLGAENQDLLDSFRILVVPKDIDALMAVSFGMAKAALTTESSLGKLRKINPKQHGLLRQLATSEEALRPVVAAPKGSVTGLQALLAVIEGMGDRPEGVKRLKMIGLDRMKKLEDSERRILQQ